MDRKNFSYLSDVHYGLWGLYFPCFFWSTRCCNKKGLRSYWHLRNSQRSDWYVSFRTKLVSRFWCKNLCKEGKFTQTFWILPLTLAVGQNTLNEITGQFHLADFYMVVVTQDISEDWPMRRWHLHIYVLIVGMVSVWIIALVTEMCCN